MFKVVNTRLACVPVVAAAALTLGGGTGAASGGAAAAADPVIAAAGDIACDPTDPSFNEGNGTTGACRQMATAALLGNATVVLPLGDTQYEDAVRANYDQSYGPSWGAYLGVSRPAVGNHEYLTPGAAGYFDYFGTAAGDPATGYYSFDLNTWHLIALNSERGFTPTSAQVVWLREDLGRTKQPCILAYWHSPRFSSGVHGNDPDSDAFWHVLYEFRADVVLTGHDHDYERFSLQSPFASPDPQGIREFVVGTGGKNLTAFGPAVAANSEVRMTGTYGVLKLTLHATSYDWQFVTVAGASFRDSGTTACHLPPTVVRPSGCRAGYWVADKRGRLRYVCIGRWRR